MANCRGSVVGARALLLGIIITVVLLSTDVVRAQVSCGTVGGKVSPCFPFVRGGGGKPAFDSPCCSGVRDLDSLATESLVNRRQICTCLKNIANVLKPDPAAVSSLGSFCGAKNSFSLNQNCATIP